MKAIDLVNRMFEGPEEPEALIVLRSKKKRIRTESNLSRIRVHLNDYDCSILNAMRSEMVNCLDPQQCTRERPTKAKNRERNSGLHAALIYREYGVTAISGVWAKNFAKPEEQQFYENSYFVVNLPNDPEFIGTIIKLGQYYCQDAVLLKPKEESAYLLGTNNSSSPGFGTKIPLPHIHFGRESEIMSKIRNRPFYFETIWAYGHLGKSAIVERAKRVLREIA